MKAGIWTLMLAVICASAMISGCGSDDSSRAGGVDETKPIAEVKAEAEKMDVEQLKAIALKYKKAIEAKQPEIQKIADKIKEIPLTEALGEEAKSLKADLDALNKSLEALKERFQIYLDKAKELKADISDLEL